MWHDPFVWTLASVATYAIAVNVTWLLETRTGGPEWLEPLASFVRIPGLRLIAAVLFLLGVPLLAIALRVVRPSRMGLVAPTSASDVAMAAAFMVLTAALLIVTRAWYEHSQGRGWRPTMRRPGVDGIGRVALLALILEAHWALYRAGALSVASRSAALAVYLSLALLAVEAWSHPRTRLAHETRSGAWRHARTAALAIASGTVFLVTGNSILSLIGHLLVASCWAFVWVGPAEPERRSRVHDSPEPTVV